MKRDLLKELLAARAAVNSQEGNGRTALQCLCQNNSVENLGFGMVKDLIEAKASVNSKDSNDGCTPLHDLLARLHDSDGLASVTCLLIDTR